MLSSAIEYSAEGKNPQALKGLLKEICILSVKFNWRFGICLFKFYPLTFMTDKFANKHSMYKVTALVSVKIDEQKGSYV